MQRTIRTLSLVAAAAIGAAVLSGASPVRGQFRTLEKNRKQIVKLAAKLEREPLAKNAPKDRRKVLRLLSGAPDLQVEPCRALLAGLRLEKRLGGQEMLVQLKISSAKFMIENPDLAGDRYRVLLAGLEGVMRTYRAMHATNMLARLDLLDELEERDDRGELGEVVREALADCDR